MNIGKIASKGRVGGSVWFLLVRIWKGTSVLLAKGTAHTGMKGICVRIAIITSASSDVLKEKMDKIDGSTIFY